MQRRMGSQKGAVSIEFVFVFIIFFMLFYGMVSLTFPLLLRATYEELSSEALREAIAVHTVNQNTPMIHTLDREADFKKKADSDQDNIINAVQSVIDDSWLPEQWLQHCHGYDNKYYKRDKKEDAEEGKNSVIEWSVCVAHNSPSSIFPQISLLGLDIIKLPDSISGKAITAFNK